MGAMGEGNPTYVPTVWQPQQPPLQIRNSRSANRYGNAPLGFSQQHNMQVAIPSTSGSRNRQSQHPAVTSGLSTERFAGFYSGPPVASLPLTTENLPRNSRVYNVMTPAEQRAAAPSDTQSLGGDDMNFGGSKTRKPRHQKKTLRRNPRKLMSRRQKYSRRK